MYLCTMCVCTQYYYELVWVCVGVCMCTCAHVYGCGGVACTQHVYVHVSVHASEHMHYCMTNTSMPALCILLIHPALPIQQ